MGSSVAWTCFPSRFRANIAMHLIAHPRDRVVSDATSQRLDPILVGVSPSWHHPASPGLAREMEAALRILEGVARARDVMVLKLGFMFLH